MEKPILFSTPMVQAIMDGRKTQTRRIIKGTALKWLTEGEFNPEFVALPENYFSPYGYEGDILWVRETFFELVHPETSKPYDPSRYMYLASYNPETDGEVYWDDGDGGITLNKDGSAKSPWKPSIHMPREACRIILEISNIRIERAQDISEQDAMSEGTFKMESVGEIGYYNNKRGGSRETAKESFMVLWKQINGEESWNKNPFVWVITFKVKETTK